MDKNSQYSYPPGVARQVETLRSGPFVFQVGLDWARLQPLLDRVTDAQQRFKSMPILPDIATSLEREVLVSSVYGTNTIEAGTLTEEETAKVLALDPSQIKAEEQRRVTNIRHAYTTAEVYTGEWEDASFLVFEEMLRDLHRTITDGLTHPHNVPGEYRDNPKGLNTKVGDQQHGGIYTPPKCQSDIELLMREYCDWMNSQELLAALPLVRAPLAHYYFERIHPFWDGNGRVGRVIEAMILKAAGFKYTPFAMSRYYLEHIDEYFTVFNVARKAEEQKEPYPNTAFIEFFLTGMLTVMNRLHDRVNVMIGILLFNEQSRFKLEQKQINDRQYMIITQLINMPENLTTAKLQQQPWYQALYKKLTEKTRRRDLQGMQDERLIRLDENKRIHLLVPGRE